MNFPNIEYGSKRFSTLMVVASLTTAVVSCKSRTKESLSELQTTSLPSVAPFKSNGASVYGEVDLTGNRNIMAGMPAVLKPSGESILLSREQFVVQFNTTQRVPTWTSWQLVKKDIGDSERSNEFKRDEILDSYLKVKSRRDNGLSSSDYTNSCFDRGHQSPAKDRSNSQEDSDATFIMSNMAPQTAFLNRGIWAEHEIYTRQLVKSGKKVQVVAGPILMDGREKIGPDKDIAVPKSFFRVLYIYAKESEQQPERIEAVVMPNVTSDGSDPLAKRQAACDESSGSYGSTGQSTDLKSYRVTLAEVEKLSGLDLPGLPK